MKILLIQPKSFSGGKISQYYDYYFERDNKTWLPLNLFILAALSDGHDVKVVDNTHEEIPYNEYFDLVGISAATFTAKKAYHIARQFRARGNKVVLGGVHPTLVPEECLNYADSVVVGEAEYVWADLLADLERGKLKRIYHNPQPVNLDDVPIPRRGTISANYNVVTVQATRGCSNKCRFCYLRGMPASNYRKRDINLVYKELKQLSRKELLFADDNMFIDEDYAVKLCRKIAPLKKVWSIQAPTTIARNEKLLQSMAQAGCHQVFVGLQTINQKSLSWAFVRQNIIKRYGDIIDKFHKYGISVTGLFVFGLEYDDKSIFAKTLSVIRAIKIDDIYPYIFTPTPGTPFYKTLKRQNRLLPNKGWEYYNWENVVFKPNLMTPKELENGVNQIHRSFNHKMFKETTAKNESQHSSTGHRRPNAVLTAVSRPDGIRQRGNADIKNMLKLPGFISVDLKQKNIPPDFTLRISITDKCNLHCQHCANNNAGIKSADMSLELFRSIIDQTIALFGPNSQVNLLGGEPLMHPQFFEMLDYIVANKLKCFLVTNGCFINKTMAVKLKNAGLTSVALSIEGAEEFHDKLSGKKGMHHQALKALKIISDYFPERNINVPLFEETIAFLPYLNKISRQYNAPLNFNRFVALGRGRYVNLTPVSKDGYLKVRDFILQSGMPHCIIDPFGALLLNSNSPEKSGTGCWDCGVNSIFVTTDGTVWPCWRMQIPLGNLKKKSLKTIRASGTIKDFQDKDKLKGKCGRCRYKHVCGGCRGASYSLTGDYHRADAQCPIGV